MDEKADNKALQAEFANEVCNCARMLKEQRRQLSLAYYERFRAEVLPRNRELIDPMYGTGAAGVFSNPHGFCHCGYGPTYGRPGPFKLRPDNAPGYEAAEFFTCWRRDNPGATPTGEFQQKCIDSAIVTAHPHQFFPRREFIRAVRELCNHWSWSAEMSRR